MYVFNKITVTPQLPERIRGLQTIANNVWWSWNTEFLRLFLETSNLMFSSLKSIPISSFISLNKAS